MAAELSVMPGYRAARRQPRQGAGPPAPPQLERGSRLAFAPPATETTGSGLAGAGSGPGRQAPPATGTAGSRPAAAGSGLAGHRSGLRRRGQGRGWSRRRRCSDEQSRRGVDVVVKLYRTELPVSGRYRLRRPQRQS